MIYIKGKKERRSLRRRRAAPNPIAAERNSLLCSGVITNTTERECGVRASFRIGRREYKVMNVLAHN